MSDRTSWRRIRGERLAEPAARSSYQRTERAAALGRAVQASRERARLSQRELAERIGTTQSAIARMESGGVLPTIDTLERVAAALGARLEVRLRPKGAQEAS